MTEFLFAIGSTLETLTELRDFTVPITTLKSQHFDYARTVNKGNAGTRGVGFPRHLWIVGLPTIEMRNELKGFCPGTSENLFIYTKLNDESWATFQCEMLWPEEEKWWSGEKEALQIWFRALILIPEGS